MENKQKGFVTVLLVVIAVVAVVLIGAGAWLAWSNNNNKNNIVQNPTENTNTAPVPQTATTAPSQPVPVQPQQNPVNCGSINGDLVATVAINPTTASKMTTTEKNSLSCFDKAVLSCASAELSLTGTAPGTFKISKQDSLCSFYSNPQKANAAGGTCTLPLTLIAQVAKDPNSSQLGAATFSFATFFSPGTKPEGVNCTSKTN